GAAVIGIDHRIAESLQHPIAARRERLARIDIDRSRDFLRIARSTVRAGGLGQKRGGAEGHEGDQRNDPAGPETTPLFRKGESYRHMRARYRGEARPSASHNRDRYACW